jgi:FkbM family methyltransferase
VFRALLWGSRVIPQRPLIKQLTFLLRRLARAATRDPVDVVQWGHRLRLLTRGNFSESTFLFMPDRWDRRERALLARELGPGAVVVDVGANAGGYIWWVLHLLGRDCTVLAVEAEPSLARRLEFNLATNGYANVRVECVAVGLTEGEAWLRLAAHNQGENTLVADGSTESHAVPVRVRPLPELVEDAGLERIDALKVDVEGMDAAILQDFFERARPALRPRLLIMERNPGPEHERLMGWLAGAGYRQVVTSPLNVALMREGAPA